MIWRDDAGKQFLVLPIVRRGNVLLAPEPARGWGQDAQKMYHDVSAPPHHQYIAFSLWLKRGFGADAVVHVGTHATHEWLSGKEMGFAAEDPPEALIQELPNVYPYLVDDVGEGIQAKRRGMAVIVDYMTPPFDKAGMNQELKALASLISDYDAARQKSPALAKVKLEELEKLARKRGILKDLELRPEGRRLEAEDVSRLDDYLEEIAEKQTPFGLHTFGRAPSEDFRRKTAEAVASVDKGLTEASRRSLVAETERRILLSARRELDSLMAALAGKYIPSGQGNDPIRNPDSLPTGKNFYAFDPSRIPSPSIYAMGQKLANGLIDDYRARHGAAPEKLTFNLWAVETITNEGVMESQIFALVGVRPKWDARGRVTGLEPIRAPSWAVRGLMSPSSRRDSTGTRFRTSSCSSIRR